MANQSERYTNKRPGEDNTPPVYVFSASANKELVKITKEGKVIIADGVSLDEASRAFWDAVSRLVQPSSATIERVLEAVKAELASWDIVHIEELNKPQKQDRLIELVRQRLSLPQPAPTVAVKVAGSKEIPTINDVTLQGKAEEKERM